MNLETLADDVKTLEEARQVIRELCKLVVEVDALRARVAELENERGQSSRNSSRPPSSDSPAQRSKRSKKPRSSRQKGAQPGHSKHERQLLPESEVDNIHRYFPEQQCECGGHIALNNTPNYRHQVFDLPKVRYQVTEHQLFSGNCLHCGKKHTAQLPEWVESGQMGSGLISSIIQLSGQFHLSIRQIQAFLKEQWKLDFSIGAISQAQGKTNSWLGTVYRQIGDQIRQSPVAHADETRHYRGTEQRWLWALVNEKLCYFMTHYSRGKVAANELLNDFHGYLVTDHYAAYNDVPPEKRQLCWSHLVRHFIQMSERPGKAGEIGARLLLISHTVFRTHHRFAALDEKQWLYQRRMKRLRQSFVATLEKGSQLHLAKRTRNQCAHLLKDEAMCWTFLKDRRIPLTNNAAERAIRPYVIWRKLSFASQSYQGDQFRPIILSIIGTVQRVGLSTSEVLRQICLEGLRDGKVSFRLPFEKTLTAAI